MARRLVSTLAILMSMNAASAAADYIVMFENDMLGSAGSDKNYTMGLELVLPARGDDEIAGNYVYKTLNGVDSWLWTHRGDKAAGKEKPDVTWTRIGGTGFTPENIRTPNPVHGDRPYASLAYYAVGYRSIEALSAFESELHVGLLGTSFGQVVQTKIHETCCKDRIPQGWNNQISDGGELTALYRARWIHNLTLDKERSSNIVALGYYGGDIGYYTRGRVGLTVVWSPFEPIRRDSFFWTMLPAGTSTTFFIPKPEEPEMRDHGFAIWVDAEGSAFLYNALLQGQFRKSAVTVPTDQIERIVGKGSLGFELSWLFRWIPGTDAARLYYTKQWRSEEFEGAGTHTWGGVYFSYSKNF